MFDIIKALTGKKFCPWCNVREEYSIYERLIINHLPFWIIKKTAHYDWAVGTIGLKIHSRHNNSL